MEPTAAKREAAPETRGAALDVLETVAEVWEAEDDEVEEAIELTGELTGMEELDAGEDTTVVVDVVESMAEEEMGVVEPVVEAPVDVELSARPHNWIAIFCVAM